MPYSARELFDRVNTFLGDNGDTRFKEVLEGLNVGTEYSIDFQDPTDSKKTYPRIYVDIVQGDPVIDAMEGDAEWDYNVFIKVRDTYGKNDYKAAQTRCSHYIQALTIMFGTKILPRDGFTLFDISVTSGSFEDEEDSIAQSALFVVLTF